MPDVAGYARVVKTLAALLAVLGGWLVASPFVLAGAENAYTHVGTGAVTLLVGVFYLVRVHRDPASKVSSIWFVLVLGVLLLSGAALTAPPGTPFFWSTVASGVLLVALAAVTIYWGSRFGPDGDAETTIFGD